LISFGVSPVIRVRINTSRHSASACSSPPRGGVFDLFEAENGVDEAEVAEALREVAEQDTGLGVDLLGVKAKGAHVADEAVEGDAGLIEVAGQSEGFDEPERGQQESTFWTADSILREVAV